MPIELPSDVAQFVNDEVATGRYTSAEDVLRDAVKSLRRHRAEVDAIQEGIADVFAERYQPVEVADAEIRRRHLLPVAE